jgi:hypothetical protein
MQPMTDCPTLLPFDYDLLSTMTVTQARAKLLEEKMPIIPLTQYRDCGDGSFVVMSDVLRRVLRPLSRNSDYLILAQFDGILFKVNPLREFLTMVPTGTQLRCKFTDYLWTLQGERFTTGRGWEVDAQRFGLWVEYTVDGVKSRSFFAAVDIRFYKARKTNTLFRFEMYQDIPGNPKWMTAYSKLDTTEVAAVQLPTGGMVRLTETQKKIVDYIIRFPNSNRMEVQTLLEMEIDIAYTQIFLLIKAGVLIEGTFRAGGPSLTVVSKYINQ